VLVLEVSDDGRVAVHVYSGHTSVGRSKALQWILRNSQGFFCTAAYITAPASWRS